MQSSRMVSVTTLLMMVKLSSSSPASARTACSTTAFTAETSSSKIALRKMEKGNSMLGAMSTTSVICTEILRPTEAIGQTKLAMATTNSKNNLRMMEPSMRQVTEQTFLYTCLITC